MTRHPSYALRKIIPPPSSETPIWKPGPPTALHRLTCLIKSHPVVLFARRNDCAHSQQIQRLLQSTSSTSHPPTMHPYRLVYLDDIPLGDMIQRRLQDLTGQWTVPHLFIKGQSVGGLEATREALRIGMVDELVMGEWVDMVYSIRPDALVRNARIKEKSPLSFAMGVQDSHRFSYVHRERWAKIKRYWGKHPEIEEFPVVHRSRHQKKP